MNGHRQLFGSGPELRAPGSDQLTSGLPTIRELCVFARIEMPLGTKRARTPITQA